MSLFFLLASAFAQDEPIRFEYRAALANATPGLHLPLQEAGCTCTPVAVNSGVVGPHTPDQVLGKAEIRVEFRKGRVDLVSVSNSSPGIQPYLPCIKHQLAHHEWRVNKGSYILQVVHTPEPTWAPDREPDRAPDPTAIDSSDSPRAAP